MSDRELLELAAKAAGIETKIVNSYFCVPAEWALPDKRRRAGDWRIWNPIEDDSDALRLLVKLGLSVYLQKYEVIVRYAATRYIDGVKCIIERADPDPYVAIRRAITRAAAEIGKEIGMTGALTLTMG